MVGPGVNTDGLEDGSVAYGLNNVECRESWGFEPPANPGLVEPELTLLPVREDPKLALGSVRLLHELPRGLSRPWTMGVGLFDLAHDLDWQLKKLSENAREL